MIHPYKDILIAIANGEQIQWRNIDETWRDEPAKEVLREIAGSMSSPERYRIKPKTIRIGEFEVPEPLRETPAIGEKYFVANTASYSYPVFSSEWSGDDVDFYRLNIGLIHLTEEATQLHLDALLSFTRMPEPKGPLP
jgi:hypothetical protein